jgi:hypothetical protein
VTSICASPDISGIPKPSSNDIENPNYNGQRLGLIPLKADNTDSNPLLPTYHLDVIALHGLNGDAINTWTNRNKQLWLKEFLPRSVPGARVYTFGYDSKIFSRSNADIGDFARRLLSELSLERQSELVCITCSYNFQPWRLIQYRINNAGSCSSLIAWEELFAKRYVTNHLASQSLDWQNLVLNSCSWKLSIRKYSSIDQSSYILWDSSFWFRTSRFPVDASKNYKYHGISISVKPRIWQAETTPRRSTTASLTRTWRHFYVFYR